MISRLKTQLSLRTLGSNLIPGITAAIAAIPDSMANAVLVGVAPVNGLYAVILGTPIAALTTSSVLMTVTTTGALAVAAGDALVNILPEERISALAIMLVMTGAFQLTAGLLRLGSLTRYVSHAVMTGFLSGIGLLIVLGQLGTLTGYTSEFSNKVLRTIDLAFHLNQIDPPTFILGLLTIMFVLGLERSRLRPVSMILALACITLLVPLFGWESVQLVRDTSTIPRSLPTFVLPDFTKIFELLIPAFGLAVIGLVQGAGVSQSYPNPDGNYPDTSGDFVGQGIANIGGGLFQGIPVGGSLSGTALAVGAGATSRWTNLLTGIFVAIAILLFANIVEQLPMAALAGLLVLNGYRAIKIDQILAVIRTNVRAGTVMLLTFIATLVIPLQFAILLGVALSFLLYVIQSVDKFVLTELVIGASGLPEERPAPTILESDRITVLLPYGSLFFAGARELEARLPAVDQAQRAVVVLLLRGRQDIGSTFIKVISRYAENLQQYQGKLMLVGVSPVVQNQLVRTGTAALIGTENIFPATSRYGEAFLLAQAAATSWLQQQQNSPSS